MQQLKVGPENWKAITAIADSLRRRAKQVEPSYSTRQIIDACFPGTIVTGEELAPDIEEMVRVDIDAFRSHRARHVIIYNRLAPSDARRFAIMHALGHIIFDGARWRGLCDLEEREQRCDNFADESLAPLAEIEPYVCAWPSEDPAAQRAYGDMADEIASHFHVPTVTIHRQIARLRVC